MKKIFALLVLLFLLVSFGSRPFPKRYTGIYKGIQEQYEVTSADGSKVIVKAGSVKVFLQFDKVSLFINDYKVEGSLELIAKTKQYYALKIKLNSGVIEEWKVFRKGKKIKREGLSPAPETYLFKI